MEIIFEQSRWFNEKSWIDLFPPLHKDVFHYATYERFLRFCLSVTFKTQKNLKQIENQRYTSDISVCANDIL